MKEDETDAIPELYIHRNYNVKSLYDTDKYDRDNAMTHMLNALSDALQENPILPRMLVIVPDTSFLRMLNHTESGVSLMIGKCIYYLIKEVTEAISRRKEALLKVKPGAVTHREPKLLWLKMLEFPGRDKYSMMRTKFNIILEEAIEKTNAGTVLRVTDRDEIQPKMFDFKGKITDYGRQRYWQFISEEIRRVDMTRVTDLRVISTAVPSVPSVHNMRNIVRRPTMHAKPGFRGHQGR